MHTAIQPGLSPRQVLLGESQMAHSMWVTAWVAPYAIVGDIHSTLLRLHLFQLHIPQLAAADQLMINNR